MEGEIVSLVKDRGFGFIRSFYLNEPIFFHKSNLLDADFEFLEENTEVEFKIVNTLKGLKATKITLTGEDY